MSYAYRGFSLLLIVFDRLNIIKHLETWKSDEMGKVIDVNRAPTTTTSPPQQSFPTFL